MTATLRLALFGGFRAVIEDTITSPPRSEPITDFASAKTQALLAYLAFTRRRHTRDALAALFWGETDDEAAKTSLRQSLANLKKLIGSHLLIERDAVEFDTHLPYTLDVQDFEAGIRGDLQAQREALSRYRGDLLKGLAIKNAPEFEEWLVVERERLRQLAGAELRHLAAAGEQAGDHNQAIADLRALVALEPLDEPAQRQLMLLLARNGQRAAALAQFEVCRRALDRELGVPPETETLRLSERIRHAQHAVRLPAETTPLIGREAELRRLATWLADPTCRIITLIGLGGVGKTRLALRAARENDARFLHGVCFAPLAAIETEDGLAAGLLVALDVPQSDVDAGGQLRRYLSDKELLLVLDTVEQIVEPCAALLAQLLKDAPAVKFLLTSRERLNMRAEWVMSVEGLVSAGKASPAEQLFQQAALRALGSELDAGDAVTRICQQVQGLPLAIELAAPLMRHMPAAEIEAVLARDIGLLTTTMRDVDPRHRSLRAVFDQIWTRLPDLERNAFIRLSVFRAGFTREAAEQVAQARASLLAALCDKLLIRLNVEGRYDMHQMLQQYAAERLANEPATRHQALDAHSRYYGRTLAKREAMLKGRHIQQAVRDLEVEFENLLGAWMWLCEREPAPDVDALLAAQEGLFVFLEIRSRFSAGEQLFALAARVLANATSEKARAARANALFRQGWFCFRLGRFDEGNELVARAMAILTQMNARRDMAYPLLIQGANAYGLGHLQEAMRLFQASHDIYEEVGDTWGMAGVMNNMSQVAGDMKDHARAESLAQSGLSLSAQHGHLDLQGHVLHNLAEITRQQGRESDARDYLTRALALARETEQPLLTILVLNSLGDLEMKQRQFEQAAMQFDEAAGIARSIGDRKQWAGALNRLGEAEHALGHEGNAQRHREEAITLMAS